MNPLSIYSLVFFVAYFLFVLALSKEVKVSIGFGALLWAITLGLFSLVPQFCCMNA